MFSFKCFATCIELFSENGCKNVQFHIQGDLTDYTEEQIKHVVEVVADILDCDIEEILVNGVRPSTSFFLILSVKETYIWKLKNMNEHTHIRLMKLKIDFLIVDKSTIKLKRQEGKLNYLRIFSCLTL